ncbi:hypothetical protein Tco_0875080 [Tanacetum coccineum]|uniref:Uncharacterized protein n=1 Tax=Tanacetum coccineum TaxID=301880 RepID=A0ABQ5BU47_9ASTR
MLKGFQKSLLISIKEVTPLTGRISYGCNVKERRENPLICSFQVSEHGKAEEGGATERLSDATKVTKPKAAKYEGVPIVEDLPILMKKQYLQRALELSLKEQAERTQGPARPVVLREPDSGKYQPLPELPLIDCETESDEEVPVINAEDQDEG